MERMGWCEHMGDIVRMSASRRGHGGWRREGVRKCKDMGDRERDNERRGTWGGDIMVGVEGRGIQVMGKGTSWSCRGHREWGG